MSDQIRFDDGAAYERYMGAWSRLAGEVFLEWLAPARGWRWLDVGCGNGAFTDLIVERCAPASVHGIDPSTAQLAYARGRSALDAARLCAADAMALPFRDRQFDVAVMPLVIFFVPDPARGLAEMARVVDRGGVLAAYAWDMAGGGFPYAVLQAEIRALGLQVPSAPSADASRLDAMRDLWVAAGCRHVDTCEVVVQRSFTDFDEYWTTILGSPSVGTQLARMTPAQRERLAAALRDRLPADSRGRITYEARANAVKACLDAGARPSA